MSDVTVVVPVYNRPDLLWYTLASLSPEHHPGVHLDVIVIDDGSDEPVRAAGVRVVRQDNAGAPTARNHGLAFATGRAVMFLDSDDLVEPGFFAPRLAALDRSGADGAYGPWDYFHGDGAFVESAVIPRHAPYPIEPEPHILSHMARIFGGWYINSATMLWRTAAVAHCGGIERMLPVNQDVDLAMRVLISGGLGLVGTYGPRGLIREHSGPRVGAIGGSREKVRAILALRRRWAGLEYGQLQREALRDFCFARWREYRRDFPGEARDFYTLAASLGRIRVKGRWPYRLAGRVFGPRLATILREAVRM